MKSIMYLTYAISIPVIAFNGLYLYLIIISWIKIVNNVKLYILLMIITIIMTIWIHINII